MRGLRTGIPAVVYISYHYPPSIEIGARRNGALVRCLAKHNMDVIVVSKFGHRSLGPADSDPSITELRIADSSRWLMRTIVAAKQRISRMLAQLGARVTPDVEQKNNAPAASGSQPERMPLRELFIQLIGCLDQYKMWSWRAGWAAIRASRNLDARAVVASGPPMTNLLAGLWVARIRRIPFIADFRDPWYSGFEDFPGISAFERKLRSSMERLLVQRSTAITVTTDLLAQTLISNYPTASGKIRVVRNGFDGEPRQLPTSTGHCLHFLYAGEIYVNRNPFAFLSALERLLARADSDASRVSATFVGHCESYRGVRLADWLRGKRCAAVVRILPPVTTEVVEAMQAEASVLLNFAQAQPLSVPAKTYEHMASGREVLVMCEAHSSTARLIGGVPGVTCVDPSDDVRLDLAIADLYRRHVLTGTLTAPPASAVHEFSREVQNPAFLQLVQAVLSATTDELS